MGPLSTLHKGLAALAVGVASLGCTGLLEPRVHTDEACRCEVEAPWQWQPYDLLDDPHLGLSWGERYVVARWIERTDDRSANSPAIILDNEWLGDDTPTGIDLPTFERLDGHPAAVRELTAYGDPAVDMYAATVAYEDGFLLLMAWAVAGDAEGYADAVALARTVTHEPSAYALDDSAPDATSRPVALHPTSSAAARQGLVGHVERPPWDDTASPPAGLHATTYRSDGRDLVAWQTPVADAPGPALLWLHDGVEPLSEGLMGSIDPLADQGVRVFAPEVRGDRGGQHELFGGEVDDVLAALEVLRARPDVDPDRIVVWGEGVGGVLAQWAALRASVAAVVAVGAPSDLETTRQRYASLYGTDAYEADTTQDALRSPARFISELQSPLHLWHGEFSPFVHQGVALQRSATLAGAAQPVELWIVPRGTDTFWNRARTLAVGSWARGEGLTNHELVHQIAAERWVERRQPLLEDTRTWATRLRELGLFSDDELLATVVRWRGATDGRPTMEIGKEVLATPAPPHPRSVPLRKAVQELRGAGLWVGIGIDEDLFDSELRKAFAGRGRPSGYVGVTDRDLIEALKTPPSTLALSYGDQPETTVEGTRRVGERLVQALTRAGLEPDWTGDPNDAVVVPWDPTEP